MTYRDGQARNGGRDPAPGCRGGWALPAALLVALGLVLSGCQLNVGAARSVARENDRLRQMNLELQRQVERMEARLELMRGQVASLEQQLQRHELEPMPDAEVPMLSRLRLGRYTGGFDTTGDGRHDTVRAYVQTLDQQGRMLPVAGRGRLRVVALPDDAEPVVVAERDYGPGAWDAAYRSGFAGTHYTLEAQLDDEVMRRLAEAGAGGAGAGVAATLQVSFTEAATGARLTVQQELELLVRGGREQ